MRRDGENDTSNRYFNYWWYLCSHNSSLYETPYLFGCFNPPLVLAQATLNPPLAMAQPILIPLMSFKTPPMNFLHSSFKKHQMLLQYLILNIREQIDRTVTKSSITIVRLNIQGVTTRIDNPNARATKAREAQIQPHNRKSRVILATISSATVNPAARMDSNIRNRRGVQEHTFLGLEPSQ